MRTVIRREPERRKEQRRDRRLYRRDVVSVVEAYRTKRGEPVGDATLACGHVVLVDMVRPARWRVCWTCKKEGRTLVASPPPGESKEGA